MSAEHAHRPGPDDAQSNGARVDSVSVSGFEMYYEPCGASRPLVLLHGAISTIEPSFGAVIPRVAQTRRLIAVEQQAHGRTADIERPLLRCSQKGVAGDRGVSRSSKRAGRTMATLAITTPLEVRDNGVRWTRM